MIVLSSSYHFVVVTFMKHDVFALWLSNIDTVFAGHERRRHTPFSAVSLNVELKCTFQVIMSCDSLAMRLSVMTGQLQLFKEWKAFKSFWIIWRICNYLSMLNLWKYQEGKKVQKCLLPLTSFNINLFEVHSIYLLVEFIYLRRFVLSALSRLIVNGHCVFAKCLFHKQGSPLHDWIIIDLINKHVYIVFNVR